MGGYDRDGPQLYMIEPSGVAYVIPQPFHSSQTCQEERSLLFFPVLRRQPCHMQRYFGAAVGKGRQAAKTYTPSPLTAWFCSYVINKQKNKLLINYHRGSLFQQN